MRSLWLVLGLFLAGCAPHDGGSYTTSGQYLGKDKWQSVEPDESKLALPDALMPIVAVNRTTLSGRLIERVTIERGWFRLSEVFGGGFRDRISGQEFNLIFDSDGDVGLQPETREGIMYAEFFRGDSPCLCFRRPIGRPQPLTKGGHATHTGLLLGFYCGQAGETDLVERVLEYVKAVDLKVKGKRQEVPPGQGIDKKKPSLNENT